MARGSARRRWPAPPITRSSALPPTASARTRASDRGTSSSSTPWTIEDRARRQVGTGLVGTQRGEALGPGGDVGRVVRRPHHSDAARELEHPARRPAPSRRRWPATRSRPLPGPAGRRAARHSASAPPVPKPTSHTPPPETSPAPWETKARRSSSQPSSEKSPSEVRCPGNSRPPRSDPDSAARRSARAGRLSPVLSAASGTEGKAVAEDDDGRLGARRRDLGRHMDGEAAGGAVEAVPCPCHRSPQSVRSGRGYSRPRRRPSPQYRPGWRQMPMRWASSSRW